MRTIPWRDVYGDGIPKNDAVKKARAAEVIVPGSLPIGSELKGIVCRSQGERVTLMDGLADDVRAAWANRIRIGIADFFVRRQPYVVNVSGREGGLVDVEFSMKPLSRNGVVELSVDGEHRLWKWAGAFRDDHTVMVIRLPGWHEAAHVSVYMEDCLAFRGRVVLGDLPF